MLDGRGPAVFDEVVVCDGVFGLVAAGVADVFFAEAAAASAGAGDVPFVPEDAADEGAECWGARTYLRVMLVVTLQVSEVSIGERTYHCCADFYLRTYPVRPGVPCQVVGVE